MLEVAVGTTSLVAAADALAADVDSASDDGEAPFAGAQAATQRPRSSVERRNVGNVVGSVVESIVETSVQDGLASRAGRVDRAPVLARPLLAGVIALGLILGCASSPPPTDPPEVVLPTPSAAPQPTMTSSTPPPSAADPNRAEIVIQGEGTGQALGLKIDVLSIVEKRTMDGSGMMRVGIRVHEGAENEAFEFESPGGEVLTWKNYRFTYRGGWRSEVDLLVERLPPR